MLANDRITMISDNVRGIQTNIGDMHSHVNLHTPDVTACVEPLNESIPDSYE